MDKFTEFFDVLMQTVVLTINMILSVFSCGILIATYGLIFGVMALLIFLVGALCSLGG